MLIALIPLQSFLHISVRSVQTSIRIGRVKLENEGLSGVKILKLNAGGFLEDEVKAPRKEEMVYATKTANVTREYEHHVGWLSHSGGGCVTLYAGVMNGEMRPDIIFLALTRALFRSRLCFTRGVWRYQRMRL